MKITENFTYEEMTRTSQPFANVPNAEQLVNLCRLCFYFLQPLREKLNQIITVIVAFRSVSVNKAVGGADSSQHLKGQAVDINCAKISKLELFKYIGANMDFDQLIYELDSNCLHVSYVSKQSNRKQILLRKKVNGEKQYFAYTPDKLKELDHV